MRKKILAVLLAVVMVIGVVPMAAMAVDTASLFTFEEIELDGYVAAYKYTSTAPEEVRALAIQTLIGPDKNAAKAELKKIYGEELVLSTFNFDVVTSNDAMDYELWGTDLAKVLNDFAAGVAIDDIDFTQLIKCETNKGTLLPDAPSFTMLLALGTFVCAVKNVNPAVNFNNDIAVSLTEEARTAEQPSVVGEPKTFKFEALVDVQKIDLEGYVAAYTYTATTNDELKALAAAAVAGNEDAKTALEEMFGTALYTKYNFNVAADDDMSYSLYGTDVLGVYNYYASTGAWPTELVKSETVEGNLIPSASAPNYLEMLALGTFTCGVKNDEPVKNEGKKIVVKLLKGGEVIDTKTYMFAVKPLIEVEEIELEGYAAAYKYSASVDPDVQAGAKALVIATVVNKNTFAEAYPTVAAEYTEFAAFVDSIGMDALNNKYDFFVTNDEGAVYTLYGEDPVAKFSGESTEALTELADITDGSLLTGFEPSYAMLLAVGSFTCAVKTDENDCATNAGKKITVDLLENDTVIDTQEYTFEHHFEDGFKQEKVEGTYHFGKYCTVCGKLYYDDEEGGKEAAGIIGTQHLKGQTSTAGILATTRYIVMLSDADVTAYDEIKVVFETSKGKVVESTSVDCAYTSFFNDGTEIKAADLGCAGFAIIEFATPAANSVVTAIGVDASGSETVMGARANIF